MSSFSSENDSRGMAGKCPPDLCPPGINLVKVGCEPLVLPGIKESTWVIQAASSMPVGISILQEPKEALPKNEGCPRSKAPSSSHVEQPIASRKPQRPPESEFR